MFFSIGAHPGFNFPLLEDESFTDYHLSFNGSERLETSVLEGPYLSNKKQLIAESTNKLPLTYDLFKTMRLFLKI